MGVRARAASERGASLVEYALLVALIAVVCISAVTFLGTQGSSKFDKAGQGISDKTVVSCFNNAAMDGHHDVYDDGSESELIPGICAPGSPWQAP